MRFPDSFLDQLRAATPLADYARRHYALRKEGAEWCVVDDPSMKISPAKNIWYDFGKGKHGGDVIELEMFATGCTFEQAVDAVAKVAGIPLPSRLGAARPNGSHPPGPRDDVPLADEAPRTQARKVYPFAPEHLKTVYSYRDRDEAVIYEVARFEWIDNGKKHKATPPRRAAPSEAGGLIWGLKEGEYLRGRSGDWYSAEGRNWEGAARRLFDSVAPVLYRLPELIEELAQSDAERRAIWLPEGEKDADTLAAWGLVATTSMGGTNGWQQHFPQYFDGGDVIIPMDNDVEGRAFAHRKAASLRGIAKRVRVLDLRQHWPGCPEKGDITDWRDLGGGDVDRLFEIVDRLPDWTPERPTSAFGAQRFLDIDKPARELEWLIKGVLTRGEVSIWYGQWGSGKSFLLTDAALAVARGVPWFGLRVRPGLVIYQAGEGGLGLRRRLRAYRKQYRIAADEDVPFILLPSRIDLFASDADAEKLIVEIKAWAAFYDQPLELVVIDTLNASAPGADENSSKDIGPVMHRLRRIASETGAHVAIVDHTPVSGERPRGWSGKMSNVDNGVAIARSGDRFDDGSDGVRREVRDWSIAKQKDEADRLSSSFVLKAIEIGRDNDGDPITSCVIIPLGTQAAISAAKSEVVPAGWHQLHPQNKEIFICLVRALKRHGRPPPPDIKGVPMGALCVTVGQWQDEYVELLTGHETITPTLRARIKQRIYRSTGKWLGGEGGANLLGKSGEWIWRSDRKVYTIDPLPRRVEQQPEPDALAAPGETQGDIMDMLGSGKA